MNRWFPFPWPLLSELWSIQRTEENLSNNIGNLHQKPESCKWTAHCRERHHPVPVNVGNQLFHHEFRVLEKSEADCLSGLNFLERHKCEPLFSRSELKLYSPHSIPLYHKNFEIDKNAIFRVVATETIKVPAGHATILPAHIPNWKNLPFHLNAVFEPLGKFTLSGDISASSIPFDFSDKTIPLILTNKTDSEITIYKNTTLGSSELLSDDIVNNVSRPLIAHWAAPDAGWIQKRKEYSKYNLQTVINSVDPNIHWRNHQQFAALANEITHVFFSSEWDLVKWDATSHRNDVYPGWKPIKIPNQTIRLWVNSRCFWEKVLQNTKWDDIAASVDGSPSCFIQDFHLRHLFIRL